MLELERISPADLLPRFAVCAKNVVAYASASLQLRRRLVFACVWRKSAGLIHP